MKVVIGEDFNTRSGRKGGEIDEEEGEGEEEEEKRT